MCSLVFGCCGGFAVLFSLAKRGIAMNTGKKPRTAEDAERRGEEE
jgi:hypothetical protein